MGSSSLSHGISHPAAGPGVWPCCRFPSWARAEALRTAGGRWTPLGWGKTALPSRGWHCLPLPHQSCLFPFLCVHKQKALDDSCPRRIAWSCSYTSIPYALNGYGPSAETHQYDFSCHPFSSLSFTLGRGVRITNAVAANRAAWVQLLFLPERRGEPFCDKLLYCSSADVGIWDAPGAVVCPGPWVPSAPGQGLWGDRDSLL